MSVLLLVAVLFQGSFWIRVVFPLIIFSGIFVSCNPLFISLEKSVVDRREFFKPVSMYSIMAWHVPFGTFLSVALSESRCIFSLGPSSSPCNFFYCCLSIWLFCYGLFILISCPKIVMFPCHPINGMSSCIVSLSLSQPTC